MATPDQQERSVTEHLWRRQPKKLPYETLLEIENDPRDLSAKVEALRLISEQMKKNPKWRPPREGD